jgi:nitrate reductase NapE component
MAAQTEKFDPYHKWLGIPPEEQPPSHYRLLGLKDFESDADVISHAADRVMAHIRTFHNGPRAAVSQRLLNELAAARVCLLDPPRKDTYDQSLRVKRGIQNLPRPGGEAPPSAVDPAADLHRSSSDRAQQVRTIVARRRSRKRSRELASFVFLLIVLLALVALAWIVIRGRWPL